jgi:hypothetical protein
MFPFTSMGMGLLNNRTRIRLSISWYQFSVQEKPVMSNIGKSTNILWHDCPIGQPERQKLLGQKGCVIWITGLSGSGIISVDYFLDFHLVLPFCILSQVSMTQLSVFPKWFLPAMMMLTLNMLVLYYYRRIGNLSIQFLPINL